MAEHPCPACTKPCTTRFCSNRCRGVWNYYKGDVPQTMTCTTCGKVESLWRDNGSRKRSDSGFCDPCLAAGERDRSYRLRNAAELKAKKAAWKKANRERLNEQGREERRTRPGLAAERQRRYLAKYPDLVSERNHRRRTRLAGQFVEDVRRVDIWKRDEGICGICGVVADPKNWHLDHIIPLARGGLHMKDNVQVSHPSCNVRKGDRLPEEVHHRGL